MAGVESQVIADVLTLDLAVFGDDHDLRGEEEYSQ